MKEHIMYEKYRVSIKQESKIPQLLSYHFKKLFFNNLQEFNARLNYFKRLK